MSFFVITFFYYKPYIINFFLKIYFLYIYIRGKQELFGSGNVFRELKFDPYFQPSGEIPNFLPYCTGGRIRGQGFVPRGDPVPRAHGDDGGAHQSIRYLCSGIHS